MCWKTSIRPLVYLVIESQVSMNNYSVTITHYGFNFINLDFYTESSFLATYAFSVDAVCSLMYVYACQHNSLLSTARSCYVC